MNVKDTSRTNAEKMPAGNQFTKKISTPSLAQSDKKNKYISKF